MTVPASPAVDPEEITPARTSRWARTPGFGTPRRWGVFLVGYASLVVGIALSITADLGVGSWQVLETGLAATTGLPFGVVALAESAVVLVLAWWWLGERPWVATAALALGGAVIGVLLDVFTALPTDMATRVVMFGGGIGLLSVGVAFYLAADLGASAQDALFVGLYRRYGIRPGVVRFVMDGSLVLLGVLLGGQFGIGTAVVTLAVPLAIEPCLRAGHRLAGTPPPAALARRS